MHSLVPEYIRKLTFSADHQYLTGGSLTLTGAVEDDDGGLSPSETISIIVNDVNTAPVLGPIGDQTVDEEVELTFTAFAIDTDLPMPPERVHIMLDFKPAWVQVSEGPNEITYADYPEDSIAQWHDKHGVTVS